MNKKAFTLLELLVVVLIIGILAAIALPQYKLAVAKSRYATIKNLAKALYEAQQRYYLSNGEYTNNFIKLDVELPLSQYGTPCSTTQCFFDWGFCSMYPEDKKVSCTYGQYENKRIGIDIDLTNQKKRCIAGSESGNNRNIYDKVCQQETGSNNPAGSSVRYYTYLK